MSEPDKSIWTRRYHLPWLPRRDQPLFSLKTLRMYLFCLASLVTAIALFYAEEDWRGKSAWARYMRQSKEKGIDLDWRSYIPPPVPEDQNFAMTPLLKPLLDYELTPNGVRWRETNSAKRESIFSLDLSNQAKRPELGSWSQGRPLNLKEWQVYFRGTNFPADSAPAALIQEFGRGKTVEWPVAPMPQEPAADILLALTRYSAQLDELRQASARPHSRFPLHYQDLEQTILSHLVLLVQASEILQLRSTAELALGKKPEAAADVRLAFFCADAIKTEPFLVSRFVRSRIIMESLQPVWEGLRSRQWSEQDLREFQQYLSGIDLLSDYERALQSDHAFLAATIERLPDKPELFWIGEDLQYPWLELMVRWLPRGWVCQNEIFAARFYEEKTVVDVVPETQRAFPDLSLTNSTLLAALPVTPYNILLKSFGRVSSPQSAVQAQTGVNLARIACGLERCRLARGHFPDSLAALVPDYLDKLPHDIINGQPLQYRLSQDGQFILYSVGWNGKDDGGAYPKTAKTAGLFASFKYLAETGDWVWRYPEKP
jgi:hypothetical protein